jgi:hypothetical protein
MFIARREFMQEAGTIVTQKPGLSNGFASWLFCGSLRTCLRRNRAFNAVGDEGRGEVWEFWTFGLELYEHCDQDG